MPVDHADSERRARPYAERVVGALACVAVHVSMAFPSLAATTVRRDEEASVSLT